VLPLFPDSARIDAGELHLGGVAASRLAAEHGTPLLVYCEDTIRAQARAYSAAAPDALVVYGTKAFANVALLRVLAEEGVGADVSTLGELAFAQAAGIPSDRILFHGNNKSDDELRAAAEVVAPGSERLLGDVRCRAHRQAGCAQPSVWWTVERERIGYRRSPSWAMIAR